MKVRIIVDSSVDIAERFRQEVKVVPLTIHFGEEELIDGVTIDRQRFYERLVECDELPRTSQANPTAFQKVFEEVTQAGEEAVVITLSSELSGTCQSACLAAQDYDHIYVVDSKNAAIGSGILTEYAIECAKQGMGAKEIAEELERKKEDVCLIALLDTLEYLKKGGRISKTVAFAGGVLNIKPVVTIQDGKVEVIGKARGSRQGNNLLIEKIQESGGIDLLGYTGLSDALLKKYIEDSRDLWQEQAESLDSTLVCSVIGTHVGPGVVAAAFFRKSK